VTDQYTTKVVGEDTVGAFTLFEVTAVPQSPQRPTCTIEKTKPITSLKGSSSFWIKTVRSRQALDRWSPKDRLHSHRNPEDVPAKAQVLFRQAGNIEKFIEETGKPATDPSSLPPPEETDTEKGSWPSPRRSTASKCHLRLDNTTHELLKILLHPRRSVNKDMKGAGPPIKAGLRLPSPGRLDRSLRERYVTEQERV
jgi:hypothetical protein